MKKNIVITILSILVIGLGSFIIYDKVINKEEKKDNDMVEKNEMQDGTIDNESKTNNEVKYKIVKNWAQDKNGENCSGEYNEIFNDINVKISYKGCGGYGYENEEENYSTNLIVNGEQVDFVPPFIGNFAIFGKYLIFEASGSSSIHLKIYDTSSKSFVFNDIMDYHFLRSWNIEENKLYFTGKACGDMCPLQPTVDYTYAKFEFTYENDMLNDPIIVEKMN